MLQDPQAHMVEMYMEEYLHGKGYTWESICHLSDKDEAKRVMIQASTYAAVKVTEVIAKAHVIEELHGTA